MKFEYYKSSDGWRWHLKGRNGEIVASGEAYTRKADVLRAIIRIQNSAAKASIIETFDVEAPTEDKADVC